MVAELGYFVPELFLTDVGDFDGAEDDSLGSGFDGEEESDFVVEDEGIDQGAAGLGVDDVTGDPAELVGGEEGGVAGETLAEFFLELAGLVVEGDRVLVKLVSEGFAVLFGLFAFEEFLTEGD